VVIFAIFNPDGTIERAQVTRPLGFGLDEEALESIKKWKFDPATRDNEPVRIAMSVEVNFHLY